MPILIVLMFLLGTDLSNKSFTEVARNPKGVIFGMIGQLVLLPAIAFLLGWILKLPPIYYMGIVLIACCPGGSSSNVFTMLAKGDVALSVTLTALSSIITLFTLPVIMEFVSRFISVNSEIQIELPIGKLIVQNIVLLFLPLFAGLLFKHYAPVAAAKTNRILSKAAFPALMVLAFVFFLQYTKEICDNFLILGLTVSLLILLSMICSSSLAHISRCNKAVRRTITIEVGMQNAAQAIAIASSPFIFDSGEMAIPAIIYALMMNIILLIYVFTLRKSNSTN